MNRSYVIVAFIAAVSSILLALPGHAGQIGKPIPGGPSIVQLIGCLEQRGEAWWVTKATEPEPSQSTGTSEASVKAAATKALGMQQFRLIGLSVFDPNAYKGHKVEVKGILIKDERESRVNVTSLQTAASTCTQ